jgi:predicted nucleic acid-binding protein
VDEKKLTAVADSTFLIGLSLIQKWDLLPCLFEKIYASHGVWKEVAEKGSGRPGEKEIRENKFIEIFPVENIKTVQMLQMSIDRGEAETILLAQELHVSLVLLDDLKARKVAEMLGLSPMGIAGFLLLAKKNGFIEKVRPFLECLQTNGFRLSCDLIEAICREANEE